MREWLKELRGNISQDEIAKQMGITRQYYNLIERGERQKSLDMLTASKLCRIFGITYDDIVKAETHNS